MRILVPFERGDFILPFFFIGRESSFPRLDLGRVRFRLSSWMR